MRSSLLSHRNKLFINTIMQIRLRFVALWNAENDQNNHQHHNNINCVINTSQHFHFLLRALDSGEATNCNLSASASFPKR